MSDKKLLFIIIGSTGIIMLTSLLLVFTGIYITYRMQQNQAPTDTTIDSFEKCVAAGNPVMESYPRQCRANGQTFTEKVSSSNNKYYGSSTYESCSQDIDCKALGCNAEICANKNSDRGISDCLFPSQPLPKDLGYSCKCVSLKCQWNK